MKQFIYFLLVTLLISIVQANDFYTYQPLAIDLLTKATDSNFFRRNAAPLSQLVPPLQTDLQKFFNKNTRTLSTISRNLLPKVRNCNGDLDRLGKDAARLCTPLLLTDGAAVNKILRNGKSVLKSMNKQELIRDALDLAQRLN